MPEKPYIKSWMEFFEGMANIYCESFLKPTWKKYENGKEPWQSLAIFLGTYAFERQGRSSGYFHAAVDLIEENKSKDLLKDLLRGVADLQAEEKFWEEFKGKLNNKGINPDRCPLNPEDSKSVFSRLSEQKETNIITFTKKLLGDDKTKNAFDFIKSIRGVGPKIASFFLRDAKEVFRVETIRPEDRYLLQPVDIWVWRTVRVIKNDHIEVPKMTEEERSETAKFIVSNSKNPERVNMGMWHFAAQVCGSEYRHVLYLSDINRAKKELEHWKEEKGNLCKVLSSQ